MCDKSILKKIQKALALAERAGTPEEGAVALAKAQELMLKYSVDIEDLPSEETEIATVCYNPKQARTSSLTKSMAVTLTKHFPVEIYMSGGNLMVIGRRIDAENFVSLLWAMWKQLDRIYDNHYYKYKNSLDYKPTRKEMAGYRSNYSTGFVSGLDHAFTINETEKGLIVITPNSVIEAKTLL